MIPNYQHKSKFEFPSDVKIPTRKGIGTRFKSAMGENDFCLLPCALQP